jgi:hypothetical protein
MFNVADETDMLWNGREEERDVSSACEEGEGPYREDGDSDTGW